MGEHRRGRDLAAGFYADVVAPLLDGPHAAGFLGWGSDVLGYDTERSTDHGWGPRLQVFVPIAGDIDAVGRGVEEGLPERYGGWPVRFGWDDHPVRHHVEITTLDRWLMGALGFDPSSSIATIDWLLTPQQLLLQVTAGAVFHDDLGDLTRVRDDLAWYPDEVWRWLLACQWIRISQEEAFVGRAAEVGDDLGSRVLAARIGRDLMRLCFLLERTYAPYSKWLGSAFARLDAAQTVGPHLEQAIAAGSHAEREAALVAAYEDVAHRHNALGLTEPVDPDVRLFHGRPFLVIGGERFADSLIDTISDGWLRARPPVGSIDQFVDSTDVLSHSDRPRLLRALLESDA